jgi:hypothetical protein
MVSCTEHPRKACQLMGHRVQLPQPHRSSAFFPAEDADVDNVIVPGAIPEREKEGLWARPTDPDAISTRERCWSCLRKTKCFGTFMCATCLIKFHENWAVCPSCRADREHTAQTQLDRVW